MRKELKKIVYVLPIIIMIGCTNQGNRALNSFIFKTTDDISILPLLQDDGLTIKVEEPLLEIKASDLIESYTYIPLETRNESLMGYIRKIIFYKNKIYIRDVETKMVYIFDQSGRYLNKVGRKGDGPGEFSDLLYGMVIDPFTDRLLVYDQGKRKMNYFTLEGNYLFNRDVPMILDGNFVIMSSNRILVSNHKNIGNGHLGKWDDYRIIQLDSTLQIAGGGFGYDDNIHANYLSPVFPISHVDILYNPMFSNDFYSISPSGLKLKYRLDYTRFENVIDTSYVNKLDNAGDIFDYMESTTYVLPGSVETSSSFWFKTHSQSDSNEFYTYYDKKARRNISFRSVIQDVDFIYDYIKSCCGDYIVGVVDIPTLRALHDACKKKWVKGKKENMEMIEKLKDDDNSVLVLFKLKPLKRYE